MNRSEDKLKSKNGIGPLMEKLTIISSRPFPPEKENLLQLLHRINNTLIRENRAIRPCDSFELPGGLVNLKRYTDTIIVPDLHARIDFFLAIMFERDSSGTCNLQKMAQDRLQVLCLGDGIHGENRVAGRWKSALDEYLIDYEEHDSIDEEMAEGLGLMEMVMEVKCEFPDNFHFLKGNHENILNAEGDGNHPFMKYACEGLMIEYYFRKFYGEEILNQYSRFEKNLPVFAAGENFLASHAEPLNFFTRESIIEYRDNPHIIEGLTWTNDGAADRESVSLMLKHFIEEKHVANAFYFGGHRPVSGMYNLRAEGKYIQIHNPDRFIVAKIKSATEIDLYKDIVEIKGNEDYDR